MKLSDQQKQEAFSLFSSVQDRMTKALESVDGSAKFERKQWQKEDGGGGGTMAVMRGQVVEKAGVNVSQVSGCQYPAIDEQYRDKPFIAGGVSTIAHMQNPHAPIGHMNVRMIAVGDDFWVGGGADLTPFVKYREDTDEFHEFLRKACEKFSPDAYEKYSKWCDEYFMIKHRNEIRGVGGVFFDYLKGDFEKLLGFIDLVSSAYVECFPKILQRRKNIAYDEKLKDEQLYWRGRYAEFNLVYDRGTKFGLMTGGNIEAIFVSLPPVVKW